MEMIAKKLNRKIMFELAFILSMSFLGIITFFILCKSGLKQQQGIFFNNENDYFMDFFNHIKYSNERDPYNCTYLPLCEKTYPPLSYLLLYPLTKLFDYSNQLPGSARTTQFGIMSVVVFLVFASVLFAIILYELKNGYKTIRFFTVLAIFMSGIMLFSLERANIIFLSAISLAFFIINYNNENRIFRELSYIALAVAIALKIYPVIFGVILLYNKQFKEIGRLIMYTIITIFLPFLYFKGGFLNIPLLIRNAQESNDAYILNGYQYRFGIIPDGIVFGLNKNDVTIIEGLILISFILCIVTMFISWSYEKHWKTILALTCAVLNTSVTSGYYCGLYIYVPIILFLNDDNHHISDWAYFILMVCILNPYQIEYENCNFTTIISNTSTIIIYIFLVVEGLNSSLRTILKNRIRKKQAI